MKTLCLVACSLLSVLVFTGCPTPDPGEVADPLNAVTVGDSLVTEESAQIATLSTLDIELPTKTRVQQTLDGGYIVSGSALDSAPIEFIVKTDANGTQTWQTRLDVDCSLCAVRQTAAGAYIVSFEDDTLDTLSLMELDATGTMTWRKNYSQNSIADILQAPDGGFLIGGDVEGVEGTLDAYIVKTDPQGTVLWSVETDWQTQYLCNTADRVTNTPDGAYVVACNSETDMWFPECGRCWLLKLGSNGSELWRMPYERTLDATDVTVALFNALDGGFLVASVLSHMTPGLLDLPEVVSKDFLLRKTDATGTLLWERICDTPPEAIAQAADGGYLLAGDESGVNADGLKTIRIVKTDATGQALWVKSLWCEGYNIYMDEIQATSNGGYVIASKSVVKDSGDRKKLCLLRIDADGNPL